MMNNSGTCCMVCGCVEVLKDSGFFYCVECQTQREAFRDEVFMGCECDDEIEVVNINNEVSEPLLNTKGKRRKNIKKKGERFTVWEIMNFVLRGQVEELIKLGAPSSIRKTVLQLWTYYLFKIEAAFAVDDENALPKLGKSYQSRYAEIVYGVEKKKPIKKRKRTNLILDATLSRTSNWVSQKKKRRIQNELKKAMMRKVTEASIKSTQGSLSHFELPLDSEHLETENIRTDQVGEDTLPALNGIQLNSFSALENLQNHPSVLTKERVLMILYIALLYEGCDIQLSDLLRWTREGHISYYEITHLLPEDCSLEKDLLQTFHFSSRFPLYHLFLLKSQALAKFLDVVELKIPEISTLAKKYIKELHLPTQFCDLILQVFSLIPGSFTYVKDGDSIPNYEGRVLAVLIVVMKLLLGLDGKTEHQISKVASQINAWIAPKGCKNPEEPEKSKKRKKRKKHKEDKKHKKHKKLFVWREWVKQIICRNAVLVRHHFPTKHLLCPEMYSDNFISFWNKTNKTSSEAERKYNYMSTRLQDSQPAILNFFNNVLDKLDDPQLRKECDVDFPPCIFPHYKYTKSILEKCKETQDLLSPEAKKNLRKKFSHHDVSYLLAPDSLMEIAKAKECILLTSSRSAQTVFSDYKPEYKETYPIRGCKTNVAVIALINKKNAYEFIKKHPSEFVDHCTKKKDDFYLELKELMDLAVLNMTRKKFARKNESGKKKMKRKRRKKKKIKKMKLRIPYKQYWILHDNFTNENYFEHFVFNKFPFSFGLLLKQCALLSEMSKSALYNELVFIEKSIFQVVETYSLSV